MAGAVDGCFLTVRRADAETDAERALAEADGLSGVDATADGVVGTGVVGTGPGALPAPYM